MKNTDKVLRKFTKQEVRVPIGTDMFLPNNSGDHERSIKRQDPVADEDLVNKKYVDTLTTNHPHQDVTSGSSPTFSEVSIEDAIYFADDAGLYFGNTNDVQITYSTEQTNDALLVGVSTDSESIIICQKGDLSFNFAHADQTNPTLFIHSANQATDEWISFTHDQTDAIINWGKGDLSLAGGSVGIGTAAPDSQSKLHVKGNVMAENGASSTGTVRNKGFYIWTDAAYGCELNYNGSRWRNAIFSRTDSDIALGFYLTNATAQNTFAEKVTIQPTGNVGIGTVTPATSAKLDLSSTTGALLVPRMTTAQRNALTAVNGMIIYNSTTNAFNFYENGAWVSGSGLA